MLENQAKELCAKLGLEFHGVVSSKTYYEMFPLQEKYLGGFIDFVVDFATEHLFGLMDEDDFDAEELEIAKEQVRSEIKSNMQQAMSQIILTDLSLRNGEELETALRSNGDVKRILLNIAADMLSLIHLIEGGAEREALVLSKRLIRRAIVSYTNTMRQRGEVQ